MQANEEVQKGIKPIVLRKQMHPRKEALTTSNYLGIVHNSIWTVEKIETQQKNKASSLLACEYLHNSGVILPTLSISFPVYVSNGQSISLGRLPMIN